MFSKPTYKTGGTNLRKPSKNDRAMVSGVSSILRKIKDKKNRKEVAGDMVKQFNREGVNYNKEKFLKNSRSFQAGGTRPPIYTSNFYDPRIKSYQDSSNAYTSSALVLKALDTWNKNPTEKNKKNYWKAQEENYKYSSTNKPVSTKWTSQNAPDKNPDFYQVYKKPVQPVIYKPAPKTTTSTVPPISITPSSSLTPAVQTPRQLPANTSQMQRYNYMSTEDKKRAVKKYGNPSKVPTYVDLNKLRKEVPTFKKGGQHGGLDRWFAEKWVDVKSGKPCGRQEGENRAYPACRPSKRISSKTPKTSSELSSKEKARFKATKTSSQRIPYNHKRK